MIWRHLCLLAILGAFAPAYAQTIPGTPSALTACTGFCPRGVRTDRAHFEVTAGNIVAANSPKGMAVYWFRQTVADNSTGDFDNKIQDSVVGVVGTAETTTMDPDIQTNCESGKRGYGCDPFDAASGIGTKRLNLGSSSSGFDTVTNNTGPSLTASISGTVLTVTACTGHSTGAACDKYPIRVNQDQLVGAAAGTWIVADANTAGTHCGSTCTGTGGTGTYEVNQSQTAASVTSQPPSFVNATAPGRDSPYYYKIGQSQNTWNNSIWHYWIVAWDFTNGASGYYAIYGGIVCGQGVACEAPRRLAGGGTPLASITGPSMSPDLAHPWSIGSALNSGVSGPGGSGLTQGEFAEMALWVGWAPDLSTGGGNTIPAATLALIVDQNGRPVDMGSDCSTPSGGTAAVICMHGGGSDFGAGTNHGTGGNVVPTARTGFRTDAYWTDSCYGPSGPVANTVYCKWAAYTQRVGGDNVAGHLTVNFGHNNIQKGDLLMMHCLATNSTGADVTGVIATPTGWSGDARLQTTAIAASSAGRAATFYRRAVTTLEGGEPNSVDITWANAPTNPSRNISCGVIDWGNVEGIDDVATVNLTTSATTVASGTVNVTNPGDVIVHFFDSGGLTGTTAGSGILSQSAVKTLMNATDWFSNASGNPGIIGAYENASGVGTSTARTATLTTSSSVRIVYTIALRPWR